MNKKAVNMKGTLMAKTTENGDPKIQWYSEAGFAQGL